MNASNCDLEHDIIPLEVNAEVHHGEAQASLRVVQATYRQIKVFLWEHLFSFSEVTQADIIGQEVVDRGKRPGPCIIIGTRHSG